MITRTVRAVYEDGVFRPLESVNLRDGQIVYVPVLEIDSGSDAEQARQESIRKVRAQIADWLKDPHIDEDYLAEWEDFHAFLQENRLHFPERDLGLGDVE